MGLASVVLAICGGGAPPVSPSENSFLKGTWSGMLTISRTGQSDVSGAQSGCLSWFPGGPSEFQYDDSFSERVDSGHDHINDCVDDDG